ncbi:MAG: IgGFc-binding protein ['Candidatus Kapabacteria' thiocyanatum]|uniref:IgGFc-binding protein N-terminal domain-containing protein n=1 Tax=Candidatus Kapaibacterium thiocyanatum TaxID=1895771 RepID=A0A1M3L716_9BACT|nr:IgGFc-binding protein ['Candidatus Kapabacteria' thiocyanatum]OJX61304.1 MAG: hypothetical protein BGO89_01635 ['Candidatus Kapabacteria' thiocyanatum]
MYTHHRFVSLTMIALLIMAASSYTSAQSLRDSKGTDFWLAFPPNDHASSQNPGLYIYITAERPTKATITGVQRSGAPFRMDVDLPNANEMVLVDLAYQDFELRSHDYVLDRQHDDERATPYSLHIVSDDEVTVYAASREFLTTDAWLVLPTDVLGIDHRIMSYPSLVTVTPNPFGGSTLSAFPSQFVVIATQDSTDITIDAVPGRTSMGPGGRRTTRLDKGETYLVQAWASETDLTDDLTGSLVRSTRPIAVISGHMRARAPLASTNTSRDILIEQVLPVDTWGKSCIVIPPRPPADAVYTNPNDAPLYRILGSENGTMVSINGQAPVRLDAGAWLEGLLRQPVVVSATSPVLCAIIDRSSSPTGTMNIRSGDPFLLIVPPTEQYLSGYTVANIEPQPGFTPFYNEHTLTVVCANGATSSLRVDGISPNVNYVPIPGTRHSYAHISVAYGSHTIVCDSAFGISIYGYGPAESYGYTGGMAFERLYKPYYVLKVNDIAGMPGDASTIAVTFEGVSDTAVYSAFHPERLSFRLQWNDALFVPDAGTSTRITASTFERTYTIDIDSLSGINVGDTLIRIPGRIVMGPMESDSSLLLEPTWYDDQDMSIGIRTIVDQGSITVDSLCRDGKVRLFDPSVAGSLRMEYVTGNDGRAAVMLHADRNVTVTMDVVDLLGRVIHGTRLSLVKGLPAVYDPQTIPSGPYWLRVSDGRVSEVVPGFMR